MTSLFIAIFLSLTAQGATLLQCAVDQVVPHGVRVNIVEKDGAVRANLMLGTSVSGKMYAVEESSRGYKGEIKGQPDFTFDLVITKRSAENSNVRGHRARLKAIRPSKRDPHGFVEIETELVCGEKIVDHWH